MKKEWFFLGLILLLSFFLRWNNIDRIPYGLEGDEFSDVITAYLNQYNIPGSEKGLWSLHDDLAKRFPVYPKLHQLSFAIFGADLISPRKLLVFVSIISLFFFYLISRQFLSKRIAFTMLILYSLSTYKLITSRIALQHPFSDLFVLPSMLLILTLTFKSTRSYLNAFLASVGLSLSLLTYNLAYMIPPVAFFILSIKALREKIGVKRAILLLIVFLLPLVYSSRIWFKSMQQELPTRNYALGKSIFNVKEKKLELKNLSNNFLTVKNQLFNKLAYETSDMLISYPSTLVNKIISFTFIIGLFIALLQFKKYYPLLIWLLFQGVTYHLIIGLYLPRMWFLTIGLLYLFAGITIATIYKIAKKLPFFFRGTIFLLFVATGVHIIYSDYNIFQQYALKNRSYSVSHREISEIAKKNKQALGKDIIYISPQETQSPTSVNTIYAAATFYYLAQNPKLAKSIREQSRINLGVLTDKEFQENAKGYLAGRKTIIIDNAIFTPVQKIITDFSPFRYSINQHQYFTELIPKE